MHVFRCMIFVYNFRPNFAEKSYLREKWTFGHGRFLHLRSFKNFLRYQNRLKKGTSGWVQFFKKSDFDRLWVETKIFFPPYKIWLLKGKSKNFQGNPKLTIQFILKVTFNSVFGVFRLDWPCFRYLKNSKIPVCGSRRKKSFEKLQK